MSEEHNNTNSTDDVQIDNNITEGNNASSKNSYENAYQSKHTVASSEKGRQFSSQSQQSLGRFGNSSGEYSRPRYSDNRQERGERRGGFRKSFRKEKYDKIIAKKLVIDYKQPEILKEFLTEKGKILSRYITGNSAKSQRKLVREIKRARFIGLLPSV